MKHMTWLLGALTIGACTSDTAEVVYEDSSELAEAILEAEAARSGEPGWQDISTFALPMWASTTVAPWDERVQEMLDRINAIHMDVLPGDVSPAQREKIDEEVGSVTHALSSCTDFVEECIPTITSVSTCMYTAQCGTASMVWTFVYTPESITDTLFYYGHDDRWDYGDSGFLVQSGTRTRDGKDLVFTRYQEPDNPGIFVQYTWGVTDEATIYTPWGGTTHVFTVNLSSTMWLFDVVLDEYRPNVRTSMESTAPNGPLIFRTENWSLSQQAMVTTYTVTYADGGARIQIVGAE